MPVRGARRWIDAVGIVIAEYFLVFVAIAQAFTKIPALQSLSEAPLAATQVVVLVFFLAIAAAAARASRRGAAVLARS